MKRIAIAAGSVMLILGMAAGCTGALLAASASASFEKDLTVSEGTILTLDNVNGSVTVTEGQPGRIHITAVKVVKALDEAKAEEYLSKIEIAVVQEGKTVSVKTRHPKRHKSLFGTCCSLKVQYTLQVPKGTPLSLSSVNGKISVDVPDADVSCETTNGAVSVTQGKTLSASTVNGSIHFTVGSVREASTTNGSIKGEVTSLSPVEGSLETVNGSIRVTLPTAAKVSLSAENVNGAITSTLQGVSGSKHRLRGDLNGGGETLSLESVNGSITLEAGS